jgi:uncharacterized protein
MFDFLKRIFRKQTPPVLSPQPVYDSDSDDDDEQYVRHAGPSRQYDPAKGPLSKKGFDAISNWMTGQGGINDPAMASAYLFAATIDWQTISNMCRASWLARKLVWKKAKDMMRPGYALVFEGMGDKGKGEALTSGDRLRYAITRRWDADNKIIEAIAWARQFGGSIIVIDIKGQLLDQPLPIKDGAVDYSSIKKGSLNSLRVWDRWRANHDGEIDDNNDSPNRGMPMFYVLSADGGLVGQRVHWSRVIRFDGDLVDWWTWRANACWHDSVLQVALDPIRQYDTLAGAITSLVPKARQDVVYAKGAAKMASTADGRALMRQRYQATARVASMCNVRVYDMDTEKTEQQTYSFANLDRIWEKAMMESGAAAGYPSSVLFDNQPAGLNASGDASKKNYYDDLGAERENMLKPRQLALYECIARDEFGDLPVGFTLEYKPFESASELEKSTINLNRANADHTRITDGVITAGLAMSQCKEDDLYTVATQEDVELAKLALPPGLGLGQEPDETGATDPGSNGKGDEPAAGEPKPKGAEAAAQEEPEE